MTDFTEFQFLRFLQSLIIVKALLKHYTSIQARIFGDIRELGWQGDPGSTAFDDSHDPEEKVFLNL
jgi:hypothetical protein